jgi:hypothetical protein
MSPNGIDFIFRIRKTALFAVMTLEFKFMIDDSHLIFPNFTPLAHGRIEHNELGRVHGARHEDNDNQQKKYPSHVKPVPKVNHQAGKIGDS